MGWADGVTNSTVLDADRVLLAVGVVTMLGGELEPVEVAHVPLGKGVLPRPVGGDPAATGDAAIPMGDVSMAVADGDVCQTMYTIAIAIDIDIDIDIDAQSMRLCGK